MSFDKDIRLFSGERWACNYAYTDYGLILNRISGHSEIFPAMAEWREKNNAHFKIMGGESPFKEYVDIPYTCDEKYHKDTGTTLLAQALHEGYDVYCVGYDLGGHDVYSPGLKDQNKASWVKRWRIILRDFGHERVHFLGYDHKQFLLSNKPDNYYAKQYQKKKPHIDSAVYRGVYYTWKQKNIEGLPMATLINKGKREWELYKKGPKIKSGESITIDEATAKKYAGLYPKEFTFISEKSNDEAKKHADKKQRGGKVNDNKESVQQGDEADNLGQG